MPETFSPDTPVKVEWPEILATRFHALALHFDRIMRQSPLWREFKRNAARQTLTGQQVGTAASLAVATATALRNEEAAVLVDLSIPQALEHLAAPLQAVTPFRNEAHEGIIEAGNDLLAYDALESVNNILKRIAEKALNAKTLAGGAARGVGSTIREAGKQYAGSVGTGFKRTAKKQGLKDGEKLFMWLRRVVIAAPLMGLLHFYPEAFAWLTTGALASLIRRRR
jgi:hypothetical protein